MKDEKKKTATDILLEKFHNGLDRKIFPMPFTKNNKVYVAFFFKRKDENTFNSMYLYETPVSDLIKFFAQKSIGQGYNKYFREEGKRTSDFINKIESKWTLNDILKYFKTFGVDTTLQWYFMMAKRHYGVEIDIQGITEDERTTMLQLKYEKEQEELAQKIKKQNQEFMILGGDY